MEELQYFTEHAGAFIPYLAIGGGFLVAIVAIVFSTVAGAIKSKAREATRREIAAYIAEGGMTPEQGERIIKAKFRND